ncbi:hypothetical protein [Ruegeria sp. EL01]|uniref:hypothetical protein n=1 Tax=Ruegeria sp. EL01 TaxID=2107578 RepID=UPI000EA82DE9|nr:hypothetical protein [Ruegeria sp. EL01]
MNDKLKRPIDPYDPAWAEYARQNPGLRRSLSAADAGDGGDGGDGGDTEIDYSGILPDTFKGEDGKWDTDGFKANYDELASFKAQADERTEAMPKEASGYAFEIPEGHAFPEGFDPETMKTKDEDGNDVEFDVKSMIDADDPDLPALQAAMLKHGADPALMGDIASILANRELRSVMDAMNTADEETAKLGPDASSRFSTVKRTLDARLEPKQVTAIMDSVTSADGLRGIEALLKKAGPPITPSNTKQDWSEMNTTDRLVSGLKGRTKSA